MPTFGTFTDSRDGYVYKMVKMPDGVWWSAEDLRYNSVGSEVISPYGRVYQAPNAVASIPVGTWIPSTGAWSTLVSAIGTDTAGLLIRSSTDWNSGLNGTDPYGFNGKPGGVKAGSDALFVGRYAAWWSDPATSYVKYTYDSDATLRGLAETVMPWHAIRFAAPANLVVPDVGITYAPAFYGSPFEGFEAGTVSVEIDRKLTLVDTLGGRPVLIPYAPADKDEWLVTAEFWTSAAQAREIEQRTPPRGAPVYPGISVPARSGENTFAGLAPAATNGSADTYIDPIMLQPLEVLGQKAVRVDLYGYRASFSLSCSSVSNPYSSNPATAPTTTPPAWLPRKWRVHSIEDGSNERRVIGPSGKWTGSGNPIAVNPIRPLSIQCDHLTTDQANELVAFFRGIRGNLFSLGFYPGPVGPDAPANPDFVTTKLVCKRDAGLLWSATLEVVAA